MHGGSALVAVALVAVFGGYLAVGLVLGRRSRLQRSAADETA
jgi:hypothetical protein